MGVRRRGREGHVTLTLEPVQDDEAETVPLL